MHFQGLLKKSKPAVAQSQSLLRHTLGDVMQQIGNVVNPLLRSGDEARQETLIWFGDLITGTESRTKAATCGIISASKPIAIRASNLRTAS